MTKIEDAPSKVGDAPEAEPRDRSVNDGDGPTPDSTIRQPFFGTVYRFFALYFTSLFSLDAYTAAANSPHRLLGVPPNHRSTQSTRHDFGEGAGVGMRLDPGGPQLRRGGMPQAPGGIDIPTCQTCAMPSVS